MKKETAIGLLFLALGFGIVAFIYSNYHSPVLSGVKNYSTNTGVPAGQGGSITLDASEIAKHNQPSDCWLIIDGNVYTASGYLDVHPGGRNQIIPYCGNDASVAFATKGGGGSHSSFASQQLASLLIGKVGATVTTNTVNSAVTNSSKVNYPGNREREDD